MNGTVHGKQLKAPSYTKVAKTFTSKHQTLTTEKKETIITRLRTGRTKLTHEHKVKNITPPTCTHYNNHLLTITYCTNATPQKYGINANINLTSQNDIQRVLKNLKNTNYYTHI